MRITLQLRVPVRPRNGHVAAMVTRPSGPHTKTNKAKRKGDKMALRKMALTPVDQSARSCAF